MNDDAEDRALLERIPFERGLPRPALWTRIEAGARSSRRSGLRRVWAARVAALAAGALAWLAVDAVIAPEREAPAPERQSEHAAWLADTPAGLPPEALLATLLVAQGVER